MVEWSEIKGSGELSKSVPVKFQGWHCGLARVGIKIRLQLYARLPKWRSDPVPSGTLSGPRSCAYSGSGRHSSVCPSQWVRRRSSAPNAKCSCLYAGAFDLAKDCASSTLGNLKYSAKFHSVFNITERERTRASEKALTVSPLIVSTLLPTCTRILLYMHFIYTTWWRRCLHELETRGCHLIFKCQALKFSILPFLSDEKALVLCEKTLLKFSSNLYVLSPPEFEKTVFTKTSVCLSSVCEHDSSR